MFKTPEMRKRYSDGETDEPPQRNRGRSSEDFLMFCKMILDHENYEGGGDTDAQARQRHTSSLTENQTRQRHTSSPLGSAGSGGESSLSTTSSSGLGSPLLPSLQEQAISDDESGTEDDTSGITCYCGKPYAGRPMIECSSCATWVHLACARVKRTSIPDVWFCAVCKSKSTKGGQGAKSKAARKARARKVGGGSVSSPSEAALLGPHLAQSSKRKS